MRSVCGVSSVDSPAGGARCLSLPNILPSACSFASFWKRSNSPSHCSDEMARSPWPADIDPQLALDALELPSGKQIFERIPQLMAATW